MVHNHFRPSGVRRVVELATPALVPVLRPRADSVVLAGGEPPDDLWLRHFRGLIAPTPVECRVHPTLRYLAEQRQKSTSVRRDLRLFISQLLTQPTTNESLVWAHNPGLGRNPILSRELQRACATRGVPLVLHHHDWWFDNRWQRWPEMLRAGIRTLAQVAETVLGSSPNVRHVAINRADADVLERHFPRQAGWLPNPATPLAMPSPARLRAVRVWLRDVLGEDAPVWLMPCRLLRRKNIAEALLLARWLRPEAWLVTTGGVSSAHEQAYAEQLAAAARRAGWRLRLGLLHQDERLEPPVPELLAACEVVLLTSLQEGFGLAYLEAAAAQRPLIARRLPNIAADLARFGFRFPHSYDDVLVEPSLFDWDAEKKRQASLFARWRQTLPRPCRRFVGTPLLLQGGRARRPVPFSRLTLTAQLEVLSQPPETSRRLCAPLNPFLAAWQDLGKHGGLRTTRWPRSADRWLSGRAYAERFQEVMDAEPLVPSTPAASRAAQATFIRRKLAAPNLYPLLWSHIS